jgi:hypothetical protein
VVDEALDGSYRRIAFFPSRVVEEEDEEEEEEEATPPTLAAFFTDIANVVEDTMRCLLEEPSDLKVCPHLTLLMFHKTGADATEETEEIIHLGLRASSLTDLREAPERMRLQFEDRLDNFILRGSGYRLKRVISLEWEVLQYNKIPFHVGHGGDDNDDLPPALLNKNAVVVVKGFLGGDCFRYALLSVLHYHDVPINRGRASKYTPWLNELDFTGIPFPFQTGSLPRFERQNPTLTVCLLRWSKEHQEARLLRAPTLITAATLPQQQQQQPQQQRRIVPILLVGSHYVGITNLNRLLNNKDEHSHHVRKYCLRCLRPFTTEEKLNEHFYFCDLNQPQHYLMPKERNFNFTNWGKCLSPSFVVYADIECLLTPPEDTTSRTTTNILQHHKPIAAAYLVVPNRDLLQLHSHDTDFVQFNDYYRIFVGAQCIPQLLASLEEVAQRMRLWNDLHARRDMQPLTAGQREEYTLATTCFLCHKDFTNADEGEKHRIKVQEHCHLTGQYRGAACQPCNTKARLRRSTVPVVFHNWKGYDAHHIVKEGVATRPHWDLTVVATATESYLNMRAQFPSPLTAATETKRSREDHCCLNFIDSFQFLFTSLAKLVTLCPTMPLTQTLPYPESVKRCKGVFPYSFLNAEEKLLSTSLPPQEAFFDTLSRTPLSNEDYTQAQEAWEGMRCTTFQDYMEGK